MNQTSAWRVLLLLVIVAGATFFALPNLYGEDPAVQVSSTSGDPLDERVVGQAERALESAGIETKSISYSEGRILVRAPDEQTQLRIADQLKRELGRGHIVALNLVTRSPQWLADMGAKPMSLGLDLRGGVHFLIEVDVADVEKKAYERYLRDVPEFLRKRKERIRYKGREQVDGGIILQFETESLRELASTAITEEFPELEPGLVAAGEHAGLKLALSESELKRIIDFAVKQNLTTLRNRVNQLGVAEPVVQRQGRDRIVVQLPGVKDPAQAKSILDATATLEYRAVDMEGDAERAARTGVLPRGTELFYERNGQPVLLKKDVIATGDQIVDADASIDQQSGSPAAVVTLSGQGAKAMFNFTRDNVGNLMAVLFRETEVVTRYVDGEAVRERIPRAEVISVATVREAFGKRFQTTGLTSKEAHQLSILLRAGALAAPIEIVEERTVGPSLGQDNIDQGQMAIMIGFLFVVVFMALYYRAFGLVADFALILNLVLIVAALSLLQATLTLPGIAGIVLTVGMAVDANVLIFERIREELADGNTPQSAIAAGYDKAFITIADANLTTLIAAVILFTFGTGPIKGFAVTLSIGIVTSMFTAIFGTRVVVNLLFGGRKLKGVPV